MIKFFRRIRQKMLTENKFSKYLLYAIGEIILVVIGILIALQLNTHKENKNKSDLGYKYLLEMRNEVQNDLFNIDSYVRSLNMNIKNHEAALNTKDIAVLPQDSINMIINPINIDIKISELTFTRMKNLGLTSITKSEKLNSQISQYYTSSIEYLKLASDDFSEQIKKYQDFLKYKQDAIDFSIDTSKEFEFPELYKKSREKLHSENRLNSLQFITSLRGRMLIIKDLNEKKELMWFLNHFSTETQNLLESIYDELKSNNPQIEPLPLLPSEVDFKEILLSQEILKKYIGTYTSEPNFVLNVLVEEMRIYVKFDEGIKLEIFPYEEDKFFFKDLFVQFQFNKDKGEIISLTQNSSEKIEWIKQK